MKRLALALALTLALMLPGAALSEAVSAPVEPAAASVELSLGEEALSNGLDSQYVPYYQPQWYSLSLDEAEGAYELNVGDGLSIDRSDPGWPYILSCVSSKPDVVLVKKVLPNAVVIEFQKAGRARVTLKTDDGGSKTLNLKVLDPAVPTGISANAECVDLRSGSDLHAMDHVTVEPAWAKPDLKFKSSRKGVASVDQSGLVTGRKPGSAVITVTAGPKLKASFTVNVTPNRAEGLAPVPDKADAAALGDGWTLWPRSLELTPEGGAVLEAYVLNGTNRRLSAIEGLELGLVSHSEAGDTLLARHTFPRVRAVCGKKAVKAVKLTFPKDSLALPNWDLSAEPVSVALYGAPGAQAGKAAASYVASPYLSAGTDPAPENPAVYRALLVSETDFYWGYEPGDPTKWEHTDRRNRGDVDLLADMLSNKVLAPNGSRYIVTTRNNTVGTELLEAIQSTFAGADDNDVSLFFIATHGMETGEYAGALSMASVEEKFPAVLLIETLRNELLKVPGKVIVLLQSCGSGAAIYQSNGVPDADAAAKACAAFDEAVAAAFRDADPGILEPADIAANTGELRQANKFYVLTACAYEESAAGEEALRYDLNNYFTAWLCYGVGKSGDMPADQQYAGNKNGVVDLHELYRYIGAMERPGIPWSDGEKTFYQHVQVYPSEVRYALFK